MIPCLVIRPCLFVLEDFERLFVILSHAHCLKMREERTSSSTKHSLNHREEAKARGGWLLLLVEQKK
jgi:hypothetical protein